MQVIIPTVELCHPGYSLDEIKKHIVKCAQVCYKSDAEVEDPDKWIQTRLLQVGEDEPRHTSPLAHGTIYLTITRESPKTDEEYIEKRQKALFYERNPYSRVVEVCKDGLHTTYYITTNYRVIVENSRYDDLKYLTRPFKKHIKRYTFKVNCDIGVSREANRHTTLSVSEQSTRYCNYSKDKFGGVQIELPNEFFNESSIQPTYHTIQQQIDEVVCGLDGEEWTTFDYWLFSNQVAEYAYLNLIRLGWKPQQARRVLPLDTHTEVYYTAFEDDWEHFLKLRDHQNAHPDMRIIARMIGKQIIEEQNQYK